MFTTIGAGRYDPDALPLALVVSAVYGVLWFIWTRVKRRKDAGHLD